MAEKKKTNRAWLYVLLVLFIILLIYSTLNPTKTEDEILMESMTPEQLDSIQRIKDSVLRADAIADSLAQIEREKEKAAREASKKKARAQLRKNTDEIEGVTWYYNSYFRHYDNSNKVSLYMGEKQGQYWLRFRAFYTGDDWLFIKKMIFAWGDERRTIDIPYGER